MAIKTQDLKVLVQLRNAMAVLVSDEGRIQRQLRRLRSTVSETTRAQLHFAIDSKGSLLLISAPGERPQVVRVRRGKLTKFAETIGRTAITAGVARPFEVPRE